LLSEPDEFNLYNFGLSYYTDDPNHQHSIGGGVVNYVLVSQFQPITQTSATMPVSTSMPKSTSAGVFTYELFDNGLTWRDAKDYCESIGGHLATITTYDEEAKILELIETSGTRSYYWLGGTDENAEGVWEWITGEVWDFSWWTPGEPNNDYVNQYNKADYLNQYNPATVGASGWHDFFNDPATGDWEINEFGFICEFE
jgi:hypothetical protein